MITPQDKELLENKGISEEQIAEQLACFEKGFPYLKLSAAASVEKGILAPDTDEQKKYLDAWEAYTQTDKVVVKFVPASGAASRMFKNLFEFLGADYDSPQTNFEKTFFEKIEKFAFYDDLNTACQRTAGKDIPTLVAAGNYKAVVAALLEGAGLETMDQFKLDLYEDEVFVFTPKGDLFKLAKGSTVLDFAFHIHSKLGCKCIGAKVNGKNVQLKQMLHSGDQVEIMTSNTQTPKQDWLNIVTTSKARTKIRQALKEMAARQHAFAKETLERKFKNRKIEYDEGTMMRLIKRLGFKIVTDFYQAIADEELDVNEIIDKYQEQQRRENDTRDDIVYRSAEGYNLQQGIPEEIGTKEDVLVIDQNLKGLDFKLARCCNPIYGDDVFGFVSVTGGIKIHRCDCPNASDLHSRFGYRIVKARWAGKSQGTQYPITLRVVGHDDIGIVTNITSIISKETGITLRSIGIDSHDGLFSGTLTIMVSDTGHLEALVKKLRTVKGVKQVSRN
jgi:(p)ppGpp synthase/HD superfamily hydrolase